MQFYKNPWGLMLFAASVLAYAEPITVESPTPGATKAGRLVENVGIETLGGMLTPLAEIGCQLPCAVTKVFSTADDKQAEIKLSLFRGKSKLVADARRLGSFAVVGIPLLPRGQPHIAITLKILRGRITLEAVDQQSGAQLNIERREP